MHLLRDVNFTHTHTEARTLARMRACEVETSLSNFIVVSMCAFRL